MIRCRSVAQRRSRCSRTHPAEGHPGLGALIGALAGATTLVVAVKTCESRNTNTEGPPCAIGYALMPGFLIGGAMVGAVIGYFIPARASSPPAS